MRGIMIRVRTAYHILIHFLVVLLFLPVLLWRFVQRILSFLWHPITLAAATIYFNVLVIRLRSSATFTFSAILSDQSIPVFVALALYGLGVGSHIVKWTIKRAPSLTFLISVLMAVGLSWSIMYFEVGTLPPIVDVNNILLMFISAGTAMDMIYSVLASRSSMQMFSRKLRDTITLEVNWNAIPTVRWARNHRLIVALIVLQIVVNAFVLYRLSDVESRLGGSILNLCNAEASITSMKRSIVRIASDQGEGTGTVIREDGYILTNAHVIGEDPAPKIIFSDYSFKTSQVIFRDKEKDIAVVKVEGSEYIPIMFIDPKEIPPRSALYSVGYPNGTTFRGEASVAKYIFSAVRTIRDVPTDMVQLEGVSTGGESGSPVMTTCGEVAGIVTSGTQGISLAISSKSISNTIAFLTGDPSTWPMAPVYPLEPDKSAEEAVKAYYAFIKMRDFKRAYLMLTPERVASVPLDRWIQGYEKTLDVTLLSVSRDPVTPTPTPTLKKGDGVIPAQISERISVRIRSLDLEGQDIVVRYFEGSWIAVYDGEFWLLSESNIKLVQKPGWDWFW